jgi:hypothetical protein
MEQHIRERNVDKLLAYLSQNYSQDIHMEVYTALGQIPCQESLEALIACAAEPPEADGEESDLIAEAVVKIYEALGEGPLQIVSELQNTGLTSKVLSRLSKSSNEIA